MKTFKFFSIIAFTVTIVILTSCKKEDDFQTALDYIGDITGQYEGSYVKNDTIVSNDTAFAEVRHISGNKIEIHCYGEMLDTTVVMDIYANYNNIMLCSTGERFQEIYGHMKGGYHMDHHGDDKTEWMHHMDDDHDAGDQHFGGFDLNRHQLNYTFVIAVNGADDTVKFEGLRVE